jgi:hypothetical protein
MIELSWIVKIFNEEKQTYEDYDIFTNANFKEDVISLTKTGSSKIVRGTLLALAQKYFAKSQIEVFVEIRNNLNSICNYIEFTANLN